MTSREPNADTAWSESYVAPLSLDSARGAGAMTPGGLGAPGAVGLHLIAVFGLYVMTAKAGLSMGAVSGFATAVWPPTGLSLVALWVLGYRLWPAIAAGAFVANLTSGAPWGVALGMATGNTIEAVAGVYLLHRWAGFSATLERLRDALGLILLAGIASTLLSATIGVASGWSGGVIAGADALAAWGTWWAGDMVANLVLAPALLVWIAPPRPRPSSRALVEAGALLFFLAVAGVTVFGRAPGDALSSAPHLLFPLVVWAAVRFGPRGAATATLWVSAIAIAGTAQGLGPFQDGALSQRLLALQVFMAVVASTGLILASVSAERRRATLGLESALTGKVALLQEVHHRAKNNLQVISSLLRLQSMHGAIDDHVLGAIEDTQQRIRAMALVHERLHTTTELGEVELSGYARALTEGLIRAYGHDSRVSADVFADELEVPLDTAVPCGLILQELISNAFKHGFPEGRTGKIEVSIRRADPDSIVLSVSDDGVGLPEDLALEAPSSMGMKILQALTRQLAGDLSVTSGGSTRFTVTFPSRAALYPG